ncbi:MAG: hypothetical protein GX920_10325, partial [Micrococcus sp.]|nr:hypothetical protein [Micrococcus sp.]
MRQTESDSETSAALGEGTRKSAARVESRAIWASISFAAVAVVIGLITFSGRLTPLSANY